MTWSIRSHSGAGYTLLEVIFICAVIGLLSAIAVPTVFRSRLAANEAAAIGTLRSVNTAELTYALTCGYGLYAAGFPDLADPNGDDGFLPLDLTANLTPLKDGYTYQLQAGPSGLSGLADCHGAGTATEYYVTAVPMIFGSSGFRGFASNQNTLIWQDATGAAPVEPFVAGGTVSPIQ